MGIGAGTAAAIAAVGTAVSAAGTVAAGQAQSSAASYQAQVAQNNATIERQNAKHAAEAGSEQAMESSLRAAQKQGGLKAAIAANNIDVNSGSAEDVQTSEREINRLDTLTTMNNAMLQAYGYNVQATNDTAQAGLYEQEAGSAATGADIGATGSLLSNAGSVGMKWKGTA